MGLVDAALASPQTLELTDKVLASDRRNALSARSPEPELRDAIARQTMGLQTEVIGGFVPPPRDSTIGPDRSYAALREPSVLSTAGRDAPIALAADATVTIVLFMSVVGIAALVASLVGGLRPEWLVGALLASGWLVIAARTSFLFWSSAGQTPGMRLLRVRVHGPGGRPTSIGRSLVRLVGLVLAIVPMFAGFIPVLFTERRRGLPDFLAGTVVVYDDTRA